MILGTHVTIVSGDVPFEASQSKFMTDGSKGGVGQFKKATQTGHGLGSWYVKAEVHVIVVVFFVTSSLNILFKEYFISEETWLKS